MTPIDSQVYLAFDRGSWRCITAPDGRSVVEVGCSHRVPADARRHRAALAAKTTPLRVEAGR